MYIMFEKFIEFHKTNNDHYHKDSDSISSDSSTSSTVPQSQGVGSFMLFVICIIFSLIGGLVGFRWCKNTLITNK